MKIGIDISQIVYPRGVGRYTRELVTSLLDIDHQNQYILFGSTLRQQEELKDFFNSINASRRAESRFYPIPPTILEPLFNNLHLSIDLFIGKVDLFHSSDWTQPKSKAKKVTTIHDMIAHKFPNLFDVKTISVQERRLKWVKKECDMIIAVSENTKKDISEILQIPEEKIAVIYEAASPIFYPRKAEEKEMVKRKFGLKSDYILTVATRSSQKLASLKEAVKIVRKNFDVDLVVVGEIPKNSENIIKAGFVDDEDLARLYSGAKVFVFSSFYEGFGLPVLEAMACATPVVCSNSSSLPEIGGEAAIYVDPQKTENIADGIEKILDLSSSEYENLKKQALSQTRKFSWEKAARETLGVYMSTTSLSDI